MYGILFSLIGAIMLALAGCDRGSGGGSGGDSNTETSPQERIAALEESGAIPKLERGNTLTGTDSNKNGVRDDIDAFIASHYPQEPQRVAATQYAKALQDTLLVNPTDINAVKEAAQRIPDAVHCLYLKFDGDGSTPPARVAAELEAINANTKERLKAYLAFSKALDGTTWTLPEGDTCE